MAELEVALGDRAYPILIAAGAIAELPAWIARAGVRGKIAVVSDTNVAPIYGQQLLSMMASAGIDAVLCEMPAGEKEKRLSAVESLCGQFLEAGLDRASLIVALGGGVVGDTAGYAAASFMRGIPFFQVPTTIVAQVDSSVGGKTAVNHPLGKNTIGAFHQPLGVLIDLDFLKTLPDREYRAGLAEVIKHGVIADEALFVHMEEHRDAVLAKEFAALEFPIVRSCEIKAAIVAADEREEGVRANLNYGHTFGHAVEAVTEYKRFLHGEAIAIGMCAAAELSRALGLVDEAFVARQRRCFEQYSLPVCWPELPVDATLEAMRRDKKARAGTLKFIVVERMGSVAHRTDITDAQARHALEAVRKAP